MKIIFMHPPTYPLRPMNGGPLQARSAAVSAGPAAVGPGASQWYYEPKYNGWRALVHVPTGRMFNRRIEPISIAHEFKIALDQLQSTWIDNGCDGRRYGLPEWLDCEALERRHAIGRGTLIVLDAIFPARTDSVSPSPVGQRERAGVRDTRELQSLTYAQRNQYLQEMFDRLNPIGFGVPCGDNEVRSLPSFGPSISAFGLQKLWHDLQKANITLGCDFYEGLVAKRADSLYPHQLLNPNKEFPYWIKHRFL